MLTLIKEYARIITRVEIYPFRRNVMQDFYYKPESVKFMIFDNQLAYCKLVS